MGFNRTFIGFLIGYMLGVMAYSLLATLSIWILVKTYGNQIFTLSGLAALILVTLCSARLSHWLDKFSRKQLILLFYTFNGGCLLLGLLVDNLPVFSWVIVLVFQLSINVFYTGYYAIAQHFTADGYHRLNAVMEVCGQVAALSVGVLVYFTIQRVEIVYLWGATLLLLVFAATMLGTFCETCLHNKQSQKNTAQAQSLRWFFSHPIAWLSVLGFFPYLIVMAMNQIQPIYFYQLMNLQPDALALSSIIYVLGTLLGSTWAGRAADYHRVIIRALCLTTAVCVMLAIAPTATLFYAAMFVLGITNSGARVATNSLIMQHIPNTHIGTYNGLKSSLAFMARLAFLLALNGLFPLFDYRYASYLLPAILLYAPVIYAVRNYWLRRHD